MMTTRWSPGRRLPRFALTTAALLAAALASTSPLSAQNKDTRAERDCTCVDKDGKEIDHCVCLRSRSGGNWMALASPDDTPQRARLGVTVSSAQGADADAKGAEIQSVNEDGPAAEAGLEVGDIVTRIDGKSLFEPLDQDTERDFDLDASIPVQRLLAITRELEPGQEVEVEYLRDGKAHTTTVEARMMKAWDFQILRGDAGILSDRMRDIADRMRELRLSVPEGGRRFELAMPEGGHTFRFEGPEGGSFRMWSDSLRADTTGTPRFRVRTVPGGGLYFLRGEDGLDLVEMNPGLSSYFGTDKGVMVSKVDEDSTLGLKAGDVVLSVDGRTVEDAGHLRRILRSYDPDETISFRIMRQKRETTVEGHVSK